MGTKDQSKIKTARKPKDARHWVCAGCGEPVYPGDEYFNHQLGQRFSKGYCLKCARLGGDAEYQRLYRERYGVVLGPTGQIDALIDAAFQVMHHDAEEDEPATIYEREVLTRKFKAILLY